MQLRTPALLRFSVPRCGERRIGPLPRGSLPLGGFSRGVDLPQLLLGLRQAKQRGVKIVINTDSHHTSHMEKIRYGILQARRAWLTKDDVLNTLPPQKFAKAMKHAW